MPSAADVNWMKMALDLAPLGAGGAEPNPLVGCVLTKNEELIGQGFHALYGGPHAEVAAFEALADPKTAAGCTAYVTLEPCSHFGKTPPCADALIAAGVRRVVVAMLDPFPQVAGRGIARLRQAGVEVEVGVLEAEARALNAPYLKRLATGLPWVIGKWAMSLDGKIATSTGASHWISGPESRAEAHQLRGRIDAIVVGIGTVLADDPLLTARPQGPRTPIRLVFDSLGRLPLDGKLANSLDQAPLCVVCGERLEPTREVALKQRGINVWKIPGDPSEQLEPALHRLATEGATNVLVEGGAGLLGQFASKGLLDELHIYLAPKLIGSSSAPGPVGNPGWKTLADCPEFRLLRQVQLGADLKLVYRK
ncbi:MAG: bifunctional diaminohydroxyphosphoribosylaminopyrimidine deaminase/5-amino-6-(5-phosphoribosylamino)uracil reductase RibD [Planctomycetota bacterium]